MSKSKPKNPAPAPDPQPDADTQERQRRARGRIAHERKLRDERQAQVDAEQKLAQVPVVHPHAAGIDVGDSTHWVCVGVTPDGSDPTREFPAHTPGLRELTAWLRQCGVTTVAMEASGVYGHVLFLQLLEAGFQVVMTAPQFARQIKGRPKTDRLDCQWIQRLHALGFLPSVFQPDDATQTLRNHVRNRANHVRLSAQHVQRMQKALLRMNLKLTGVLGDITGVTGLKIIRAIVRGVRDPKTLASFRDRRCKHTEAEIAIALDGRYREEYVVELKTCLQMWDTYQEVIAEFDAVIDAHLKTHQLSGLPPLKARTRVRGRKPHDPGFDVREALYRLVGIDLTEIEGIDEIHALTLISELGTDFTKWPTVKHFASWLGLCPNWKKTGGKVKSSRTRTGKNRAAHALRLAAWSLVRSKGYLGAYLRRQRGRLGAPKAITATAHKLARILYQVMRHGEEYLKRTEAQFAEEQRERQEKSLHRRAREMGYKLEKIKPTPTPDADAKPESK